MSGGIREKKQSSKDELFAEAPVLEALSEEMAGKASFYAMDVDDNPDIAQQFGISSIPYVAVFRDGKKVDEQIGFVPQPQLKAFIERNL